LRLRGAPEDFTTEEVARELARAAGVEPRDVGYAGRKDRVAVATQWFSVPGLDPDRAPGLELPGVRVLEAARHPHKLRTGHLRENRFRIAVREVDAAALAAAEAGLRRLQSAGMPNRFGEQRFGRGDANLARARRLLRGEPVRVDRRSARFLLSALQAAVFNQVLEARGPRLDRVERGDIAVIHATGGLFRVEDPETDAQRAAAFEISPTGPIFGTRMAAPAGEVAERERAVLLGWGVTLGNLRPPRGIRLRGARRALRVRPAAASAVAIDGGIELRFALPPGSYGTVLVEEVFGPLAREGSDDSRARAELC
jgi:tRNA pseudouridine13 synthase